MRKWVESRHRPLLLGPAAGAPDFARVALWAAHRAAATAWDPVGVRLAAPKHRFLGRLTSRLPRAAA